MEHAGQSAGDSFGEGFESRFEQRISRIGDRFADNLSRRGRLAANRFSHDFEDVIQTRFRRMQRSVAEILADKDTFAEFARGFDDVGDAVRQLETDLDKLHTQTYKVRDENGKLQEKMVLSWIEMQRMKNAARELGDEMGPVIERERALARETEELETKYRRLTNLVGDTDAFQKAAARIGGTEETFRRMRIQVEQLGERLGRSRGEIEGFVDRLDRTKVSVDRANRSLVVLARQPSFLERAFAKLGNTLARPWRNLDNDVRLVIGLILSAADQIAVLGSALGAGLIAVGGAAAQGAVGVGGLISVFVALNKEIDKLPAAMRPVALEFAGFKDAFRDLNLAIAGSAFARMDGVFTSLSQTLNALTPALSKVGTAVGNVFRKFASAVRPGTEAFGQLSLFIDRSAGGFQKLAGIAGTLGLALVRSFNRASPIVQDFIGWVDRLVSKFDAFTRSRGFDEWIANAQRVWTSFGALLDQVGRSLNNLANPASVERTTQLLDNLTAFTPALERLLALFGTLNPLGLLAQALNEIGAALEPLHEPMMRLAEAMSGALSAAISGVASAIEAAAPLIGLLADNLASLIRMIPPPVISALAGALMGLAASTVILKGANGLAGLAEKLTGVHGPLSRLAGPTGAFSRGLAGLGRLVGTGGVVVLGLIALKDGVEQLERSLGGYEQKARKAVSSSFSLKDSFKSFEFGTKELTSSTDDLIGQLDVMGNFFTDLGARAFDLRPVVSETIALHKALTELDRPMATLAQQSLPEAQAQLSAWVDELGASDEQVLVLLRSMPELSKVFEDAAISGGDLGTEQDILNAALGRGKYAAEAAAAGADTLAGKAKIAEDRISGLHQKMRDFVEGALNARSAARDYESAIDDLTASVQENGTSLDITTEAGRLNEAAVDDLAAATIKLAEETEKQTGKQSEANKVIDAGRNELIKQLAQFGITGQAAIDYVNKLGLIPDKIQTRVDLEAAAAQAAVDAFIRTNDGKRITIWVDPRSAGNVSPGRDVYAGGGVLHGPRHILAGEAGPEAIVPLNRPLSQVDPSVRWLSAIAQGLKPMASGGVVGGGRTINVAPGAIVVEDRSGDPLLTSLMVVDRLAERIVA